jgi:glycine cleavage system H protein
MAASPARQKGAIVNPRNLKYHKEHDWARIEGDKAVFGVTDFAQESLGDIVFLELPEVGTVVTAGAPYAEIESVKAVSDVLAPLSGSIIEVNEDAVDAPEVVNDSPFEEGWLVKVQLSDPNEVDDLMTAEEYDDYLAEQEE